MFLQARHQFDEVAGLVADVQLVDQDLVPAVLAGPGRARQHEDIGAVGDARGGPRLDRRGLDLLIADPAEHLAEAGDDLFRDGVQGFGRYVTAGHAGAAGRDDAIDLGVGDPFSELLGDQTGIVLDDGTVGEAMPATMWPPISSTRPGCGSVN